MENSLENRPRFLVAKYAPDLERMEPRNIGVILWSHGSLASRFIGDDDTGQPTKAPDFIARKNQKVYHEWVRYWQKMMDKPTLPGKKRKPVGKDSPDFLEALRLKSRDNYVLANGGILLGHVSSHLDETVDELFESLVCDTVPTDAEHKAYEMLRKGWRELLKTSGLKHRSDFKKKYELQCQINNVPRRFHFDAAIGNGKPDAVFQKANLHRDESVHSVTFMLENMRQQNVLPKNRCIAVCYAEASDLRSEDSVTALELLQQFGTVVNVANPAAAAKQLDELELPPPPNTERDAHVDGE